MHRAAGVIIKRGREPREYVEWPSAAPKANDVYTSYLESFASTRTPLLPSETDLFISSRTR